MNNRFKWLCILLFPYSVFAEEVRSDFSEIINDERPIETIEQVDYFGFFSNDISYVSSDNFYYGRYTGESDKGYYLDLNFYYGDFSSQSAEQSSDSQNNTYWKVSGNHIGLDASSIEWVAGSVNRYKTKLAYQSFIQVNTDSATTPFLQSGSTFSLPSDWVSGGSTTDFSNLNLRSYQQDLKRSRFELSFDWTELDFVNMATQYFYEDKKGTKNIGAAMYYDASNGRSVILPQPVKQNHSGFEFNFSNPFEDGTWSLAAHFSSFKNDIENITWQNPYTFGFDPNVDYPNGFGQLSSEPEHNLFQLSGSLNYRMSDRLMVQSDLMYSNATNKQPLMDYSVNSNLTNQSLPINNFEGDVVGKQVNFKLHYLGGSHWWLDFLFKLDDRQNKGSRYEFLYTRGDAWASTEQLYTVYNRPYSYSKQLLGAEYSYRWSSQTRVELSYNFEAVERYNQSVNTTEEDQFKVAFKTVLPSSILVKLSVWYFDKQASVYNWDSSYFSLYDAELINLTPDNQRFSNHPLLSQFHLANRNQTGSKFYLSKMLSERSQLNFDWYIQRNDYKETELGLNKDSLSHYSLNYHTQLSDDVNFAAYYNHEKYEFEQTGRSFSSGVESNPFEVNQPLPQASDPSRNWQIAPTTDSATLGFTFDWVIEPKVWDMSFNFYWLESSLDYSNINHGGAISYSEDGFEVIDQSERHAKLMANYQVNKELKLKFGLEQFRFRNKDWSYFGVTANSSSNVLQTGEPLFNDSISMLSVTAVYQLD